MSTRPKAEKARWLLLAIAAGCARPSIEAPSWVPLEPEQVRAALQEPTGQLAHVDAAALEDALSHVAPVLIEVAHYLATIVQIVAEVSEQQGLSPGGGDEDAGTPAAARHGAAGAQLFLSLACPGDALEPPFSFDGGELRVDCPVLDALADLPTLLAGADALFDFRACDVGTTRVDGAAPALFTAEPEQLGPGPFAEPPRFGIALDFAGLDDRDHALPLGVAAFACAGALSCGEQQAVSAQVLAGDLGTYTLSFVLTRDLAQSPTRLALMLAAADGEAECAFDGATQRATCSAR